MVIKNKNEEQSHNNLYVQSSGTIFNHILQLKFFVFLILGVHTTLTSVQLQYNYRRRVLFTVYTTEV